MKARDGTILLVVEEGDGADEDADHVIEVLSGQDLLCTLLWCLFSLAYRVATARGLDVDKPRNLAKTVTVE